MVVKYSYSFFCNDHTNGQSSYQEYTFMVCQRGSESSNISTQYGHNKESTSQEKEMPVHCLWGDHSYIYRKNKQNIWTRFSLLEEQIFVLVLALWWLYRAQCTTKYSDYLRHHGSPVCRYGCLLFTRFLLGIFFFFTFVNISVCGVDFMLV